MVPKDLVFLDSEEKENDSDDSDSHSPIPDAKMPASPSNFDEEAADRKLPLHCRIYGKKNPNHNRRV